MILMTDSFFGNTVSTWSSAITFALALFVSLLLVRRLLVGRISQWAQKTDTEWDDILAEAIRVTHGLSLLAVSLYLASRVLQLPASAEKGLDRLLFIALMLQLGRWGSALIQARMTLSTVRSTREGNGARTTHMSILAFVMRTALWVVVLLAMLNNLGFDITALIASLGIGGVAVALAVQNILGDLFASLSIALDKPFLVGDFIVVDNLMGTVKHVGLKTTRIQSLSGEELIVANNDLLKSRIRNFKHMDERRVVFNFGLTYDTPPERLESLPDQIRTLISDCDATRFDRAHFKAFGAYSLDFEVVYYVTSADFNLHMDIQQRINLALMRHLRTLGIEFAFPTQSIQLTRVPA